MNEPFFQGHFTGRPIMPGVIIIEAIAQLGGIMILSEYDNKKVIPYLVGIDKLRIRKPVLPGDQLLMETSVISLRGNMGKVKGCAKVNNETVAELEVMFAIVEEEIK